MDIESIMKFLLEAASGQFGVVAQVMAQLAIIIGSVRLVVKPLRSIIAGIKAFIKATPSQKDDEVIKKVEGSRVMKMAKKVGAVLVFLADLILSVKVPAKR